MLLSGTCKVLGRSDKPGLSFTAINPYTGIAVVVGRPVATALLLVAERLGENGGCA
jgi:hypothetical protein